MIFTGFFLTLIAIFASVVRVKYNNSDIMTLTETYFNDHSQALEEAARIRASSRTSDVVVKIDESPYGGYRIRVIPTEIAIDMAGYEPFNRRWSA